MERRIIKLEKMRWSGDPGWILQTYLILYPIPIFRIVMGGLGMWITELKNLDGGRLLRK